MVCDLCVFRCLENLIYISFTFFFFLVSGRNIISQDVTVCGKRHSVGGTCENPLFFSRYSRTVSIRGIISLRVALKRVVGMRVRALCGPYSFGIIGMVHCVECDAILGFTRNGYHYLNNLIEIWDADECALLGLDSADSESEDDADEDSASFAVDVGDAVAL